MAKIEDADNPGLWNPGKKELKIILDPHKIAKLNILPKDIISSVRNSFQSYTGGFVREGRNSLSIQLSGASRDYEDIGQLLIQVGRKSVYLSQIANIEYSQASNQRKMFKTNGSPSLILYSKPKGDGNVKRMSEQMLAAVKSTLEKAPKDIQYRELVDPSSFIKSAIKNVFHEVVIAAILAVGVLFLFMGNLKNVITTALEIPLSMIVAFALMKVAGINLNLISLGGLALAAGMNVDASVVVLENIFRHLKTKSDNGNIELNSSEKMDVIMAAVKEVAVPILVSMFTTLIVFIPIAFTSDLTNAILGDLAKAVIFSHCFSAFVAIIFVPSIRFQILNKFNIKQNDPPIAKQLSWLEEFYVSKLNTLIFNVKKRNILFVSLAVTLVLLGTFIIPTLPKELIGKPESDWVILGINSSQFEHIREMEEENLRVENKVLSKYGDYIKYTFVQVRRKSNSNIMFKLKDKSDAPFILKKLEEDYKNTPTTSYWASEWNPASMPIPDPDDLSIKITGNDQEKKQQIAEKLIYLIKENRIYKRVGAEPSVSRSEYISIEPYKEIWDGLRQENSKLRYNDIIDIMKVAQGSKKVTELDIKGNKSNVYITFGHEYINNIAELKGFPINIGGKVVSLSALAKVQRKDAKKTIYREDGTSMMLIDGKRNRSDKSDYLLKNEKIKKLVANSEMFSEEDRTNIEFKDAKVEMNEALSQLLTALFISLLLIFIVLIMQFENIISPLIVMVAIPLGFIGVFISLYVFDSNLSLNSALGMVLLNGIAVNNSILLIDFSNKLFKRGLDARSAVLEASRKRLRPILITSLTTILGMAPVAFGFGEGGKILQPLGVAVSGGLWFSTFLTLLVIPVLQYLYLKRKAAPLNKDENTYMETKISDLFEDKNKEYAGESLQ